MTENENNFEKTAEIKSSRLYALNIHLKNGEVIHLENLSKEEKNRYFEICEDMNSDFVMKKKNEIRHVLSTDISKITAKEYSSDYKKYVFPVKNVLLNESKVSTDIFTRIITAVVILSMLILFALAGKAFLDSELHMILLEAEYMNSFVDGYLVYVRMLVRYSLLAMVLLVVLDLIIIPKKLSINNENKIYDTKLKNIILVVVYYFCYLLAIGILNKVVSMIV